MKKIICVIVTYNRIEKLKKAIQSYDNQKVKPYKIIVIDNHSNDGTTDYLKKWSKEKSDYSKKIVYLDENTGGSGGFYIGIRKALEYDSDWIYVSDDDAYLESDVIEKLQKTMLNIDDNVGAICGKVITQDGIDYMHRRIIKEGFLRIKEKKIKDVEYKKKSTEISVFSFVGTALRTEFIWNIGLPNKDFFLWYDDVEYGVRMSKHYKIVMFPNITIYHDVEKSNFSVNWKRYYGYRNSLLTIKYNYGEKYFKIQCLLLRISILRDIIIKNRRPLIKMKKQAINDAKKNKLGRSEIYYPGMKISKGE